ncbi:PadR family transcriptional regulator [Convivina intestini]|uniref:PadR family transcriptional regulator n=1 Tax=Convivina intestini TaxID=1505726 RepID=UPI00200BD1EA|nr:PadR family transcriptional regulator [Convivina intestini]CAH1853255.1 hypothetical protein R078131_00693 [Convivina intestini]
MYDLLILTLLSSRTMSGYKLALILGSSVMPRRKISNGIIYPLLTKLEHKGYIQSRCGNSRNAKVYEITTAGKQYLQQLMQEPVSQDGNRDNIYCFKFRSFGYLNDQQKLEILQDYQAAIEQDLAVYDDILPHFSDLAQRFPAQGDYYKWVIRTVSLQQQLSHTKLTWVQDSLKQLNKEEK